jgi:hypothetical protein
MTAKEKARDLVEKYYHLFSVKLENTICIYEAKHCALIAVNEIISDNASIYSQKYWQEVKQEIEKL